jgi:hypothetical protein
MTPVRNLPDGTNTLPPPPEQALSIACWIDTVLLLCASGLAPKDTMSNTLPWQKPVKELSNNMLSGSRDVKDFINLLLIFTKRNKQI